MASVTFEAFDVFRCVDVDAVAAVVGDERQHGIGMCGLPLAAADIRGAGQDLLAHVSAEDHWVAAFAVDLWVHDLHAVGPVLKGADEHGHVLRVDQRLVGQRHDDRIEPARQRRQPQALRRDLALVGVEVAHQRHREGLHQRFDELGVVAQHNHHFIDSRARQRDELAADERHTAQLQQALRPLAQA